MNNRYDCARVQEELAALAEDAIPQEAAAHLHATGADPARDAIEPGRDAPLAAVVRGAVKGREEAWEALKLGFKRALGQEEGEVEPMAVVYHALAVQALMTLAFGFVLLGAPAVLSREPLPGPGDEPGMSWFHSHSSAYSRSNRGGGASDGALPPGPGVHTHSLTFPAMSYRPQAFGARPRTGRISRRRSRWRSRWELASLQA